jgi:hypothetical protein
MPGQLRIVWQASTMRCWSASSLSTGAAYTRVFRCLRRFQIWRGAWSPCSGSSSTYQLVMIGITNNTSQSTAKICRSTITHVPHSCSDCQWYIFQSLRQIMWEEISVVVVCKLMRQNMWLYQTITTIPAHTIMLNWC